MPSCYNLYIIRKSLQYNALLVITGAIKGSSNKILYEELGLESLQNRRWLRKLCVFYRIVKGQSSKYFLDLIPSNNNSYQTRNRSKVGESPV